MIGIFENLPDEIIDKIWNYTHNKNMENICKNIKDISNYFDYKNVLIDSTKFIIKSINNSDEYSFNRYWIDSLSKSLRLVHLRFWLNHFRIMKIICGEENMLKLFNHINSSSLLIKLLSNKKAKNTNNNTNNNTKFNISKEYYVPNDEKPLKYFCDNYLIKNGYNGKSIYSWDTAFKTFWLIIN
tara:strand:- start:584 stop:1135 length:552 start_codon:yes stop_codon:yes gene_type:complete